MKLFQTVMFANKVIDPSPLQAKLCTGQAAGLSNGVNKNHDGSFQNS